VARGAELPGTSAPGIAPPDVPMSLEDVWYRKHALVWVLLPLAWLYCLLVRTRRWAYRSGVLNVYAPPVPVVVVGNVTVGGTGKTPLVAWLVDSLRDAGLRPGIVSRGYGGKARHWPQQVRPDSDPMMVGDEPLLLARRCRCPIAVAPDRTAAVRALLEHCDCDVIVSDDGLQHYALGRTIEVAVVDGVRRLGNGRCLPAGPLREPRRRLQDVDFVVCNGAPGRLEYAMKLVGDELRDLNNEGRTCTLESLRGEAVHAVAGIGNPQRFFSRLRDAGLAVREHPFPDHYAFRTEDLQFGDGLPVVMTEKDAVKCRRFAPANAWYLPVNAQVDERFGPRLLAMLHERRTERPASPMAPTSG
jgi:tetraacyldisaccharide 4'-kinase